jgi:hypothetical protein
VTLGSRIALPVGGKLPRADGAGAPVRTRAGQVGPALDRIIEATGRGQPPGSRCHTESIPAFTSSTGHIGQHEITASSDRRSSVGDRVIARTPDRDLHPAVQANAYVRNGALGTVTALRSGRQPQDDTITVAFDGIGTIDLPRSYFDEHRPTFRRRQRDLGLDHAYAVTSYAVQGATRAVSTSRIDPTATRAEAYVDITRGQTANHLYLTRPRDPLDGEALPAVPPPPSTTPSPEGSPAPTESSPPGNSTKPRASALSSAALTPSASETRSSGRKGA